MVDHRDLQCTFRAVLRFVLRFPSLFPGLLRNICRSLPLHVFAQSFELLQKRCVDLVIERGIIGEKLANIVRCTGLKRWSQSVDLSYSGSEVLWTTTNADPDVTHRSDLGYIHRSFLQQPDRGTSYPHLDRQPRNYGVVAGAGWQRGGKPGDGLGQPILSLYALLAGGIQDAACTACCGKRLTPLEF